MTTTREELREKLSGIIVGYWSAGADNSEYTGKEYEHDEALDLIMELIEQEHQKFIKENTPVTIMGKTLDEVVTILSGLELERITDIEVTMSNLGLLAKKLREDMQEATQKAMNRAIETALKPQRSDSGGKDE